MINPLPAYEELKDVASREFLIGAFFPWIFVIVADLAIYEGFVPDGISLVDRFLWLDENDQLYAAIAIVIGIAGLAAASDFVAEQITRWYRQQSWLRQDHVSMTSAEGGRRSANDALASALHFEAEFARVQAEIAPERAAILNPRIASIRGDIKRSGIFIIGFGISILFNTWELRIQPDPWVSVTVLMALWLLMVVSFVLIHEQFKLLCHYDALLYQWAREAPRQKDAPP